MQVELMLDINSNADLNIKYNFIYQLFLVRNVFNPRKMLLLPLIITICTAVPPVTHLGDAGDGVLARFDYRQTFKYPFFTKNPDIPYFNK